MKIFVEMIAYNEELLIEAAIRSVYDYVTHIFVVDGSPFGPSKDSTAEIAGSIGSKVTVVSGTYANPDGGVDHKVHQRNACLALMPRDATGNIWGMATDADEVWDAKRMEKLVKQLENMKKRTKIVGYKCMQYYMDCWHYTGFPAVQTRLYRLLPKVKYTAHNRLRHKKEHLSIATSPIAKWFSKDIFVHHYGHAQTYEKALWKAKYYFDRGDLRREPWPDKKDWDKYFEENWLPRWKKGLDYPGVVIYDGKPPRHVRHLIGTHWPKRSKSTNE